MRRHDLPVLAADCIHVEIDLFQIDSEPVLFIHTMTRALKFITNNFSDLMFYLITDD